jgi:retron-type reverse transcriptase
MSCRRRKRNTINALRFEASLLDNLSALSDTLSSGSYKPSRSVCFVAKQPKHREIFAADFRDRVVHHLLVPQIEKIFEPKFIHDSYACRVGKGTHAAVERLKVFMKRVSKDGRVAAWFMQLDVRSFFMSIDREILLCILSRHIREPRIMALAETIVRQDCTKNLIYKGDPRLLRGIPPHKSLFSIPEGKGLPIGNLTSQFFGNVYLNELDQFVKHELKGEFYLRYVDDFILLDQSRERLIELREKIREFLESRLALELKSDFTLKRVSEGSNFLGYIVRPDYVLVRNRVIGNLRARLRRFEGEMVEHEKAPSPSPSPSGGEGTKDRAKVEGYGYIVSPPLLKAPTVGEGGDEGEGESIHIHLREETIHQLRQTLASYLGHFKHADSYRLTQSLFEKYTYLKDIFAVDEEGHLRPLYEPLAEPASLRGQYRWVTDRYKGYCVFFQVGRFCEFYGLQAERYGKFFGLSPLTPALSPKGRGRNVGTLCGFPVRYLKEFKTKALNLGAPYVVVGERGYYPSGLKKRVITEIFKYDRRDL